MWGSDTLPLQTNTIPYSGSRYEQRPTSISLFAVSIDVDQFPLFLFFFTFLVLRYEIMIIPIISRASLESVCSLQAACD